MANFFCKPINRNRKKSNDSGRGISIVLIEESQVSASRNELHARVPNQSFTGLKRATAAPSPFLARQWYRLPKKEYPNYTSLIFYEHAPCNSGAIVYTVSRAGDFREESRIVLSKGEEEVAKGICRLLSLELAQN